MKKKFLILCSICLGILISHGNAFSQSTTICFDLNITDNCSGEWPGYYTERVTIIFGGNSYCGHTFYNLSSGPNNDLSYDCSDLPIDGSSPQYAISAYVCRQQENPTCCGSNTTIQYYYSRLDDCDIPLSVTLN